MARVRAPEAAVASGQRPPLCANCKLASVQSDDADGQMDDDSGHLLMRSTTRARAKEQNPRQLTLLLRFRWKAGAQQRGGCSDTHAATSIIFPFLHSSSTPLPLPPFPVYVIPPCGESSVTRLTDLLSLSPPLATLLSRHIRRHVGMSSDSACLGPNSHRIKWRSFAL